MSNKEYKIQQKTEKLRKEVEQAYKEFQSSIRDEKKKQNWLNAVAKFDKFLDSLDEEHSEDELNKDNLEEAGRITYSRAERQAMGSGEAADDHPYYYDMESSSQLARVNAWLRGTAKRLTMNPDSVYQEIKQKLVLLGIVVPNYEITPEDEAEGEIAFEAEWYPGYREGEDGGIEKTSMSAERIPGGLWLIMNIRTEESRYSLDMKLVVGADYFDEEELDAFDDVQNDEEDFEDDDMSESHIDEAELSLKANPKLHKKVMDKLEKQKYNSDAKHHLGIVKRMNPKKLSRSDLDTLEDFDAMYESSVIDETVMLPVKKVKDINDFSLEKEAKKLLDDIKKSKDKDSVVVFTDFGGQKSVEIMDKNHATFKKMAKEKFGYIIESPKI